MGEEADRYAPGGDLWFIWDRENDYPLPRYPDAPTEAELRALDHPDECCSPTNYCGNDHMTHSEAEAKEMQEQTSEYRRMTE